MGLVIPWTDNEIKILKDNYEKMTSKQLAKIINRSKCAIDIRINKLGLVRRKYFYQFDYFRNIDTPEKAYWLGFICADGSVNKDEVSIKLQASDIGHLKKINKALRGNVKPTEFERQCNLNDKWYKGCQIRFHSREMIEDLNNNGVHQNKSLTIEYPNVKAELNSHFVRGYFDGNGCITKTSHKSKNFKHHYVRCDFTCGSIKFVEKLREVLNLSDIKSYICQEKNNTYRLRIGGMQNVDKFFNYIYKDAKIYLDRKYNKKIHLYESLNIEQRLLLHAEKHAKRRLKRERILES